MSHDEHASDHHHGRSSSGPSFNIPWRVVVPVGILLIPLSIFLVPQVMAFIIAVIAFLTPLWLPALLLWIVWPLWLTFIRSHYVRSIPYETIELVPGPSTPRSARSMEAVFSALHHRTESTRVSEYLLGQVRMPWAFEIWAHAGNVRFFARVPSAHREAVESRIRAEYHDIEIHRSDDYARMIPYDPQRNTLLMREFALQKPDPYPLKTYAQFEAELGKRDVFADLLESMLTVGEKEHLCLSFIVRSHQREREGIEKESIDFLHRAARKEIQKLLGPSGDLNSAPAHVKKLVSGIEAALKKPSFDCGARALYVAETQEYDADAVHRLEGLLDTFNDPDLNGFAPYDPFERMSWLLREFSHAVPAFKGMHLMNLYRRRAFFAPPYYGNPFVLNAEELATVFHIPHYARASALSAVRGVRLEPPANLPV